MYQTLSNKWLYETYLCESIYNHRFVGDKQTAGTKTFPGVPLVSILEVSGRVS